MIFTSDNGGVDFDQRSIVPTSNLPLRSGKGTLYEGGLRVPLLIRWPGKTSGETVEFSTSQDFYPTFEEMLDTKNNESSVLASSHEGFSLIPLLDNPKGKLPERVLYWHFPHYYPRMTPGSALRHGDWKLHHYYEDDRLELYNLRTDPGELQNLAASESDRAERLARSLDQWRHRVGANAPTPAQ